MDIFQLSEEFKIPVAKLKRMQRRGFLPTIEETFDIVQQAKLYLNNKRPLSTAMLIEFSRKPSLLKSFTGAASTRVHDALDEIGDPNNGAFHGPSTEIIGASMNEPESVRNVTNWLLRSIPPSGCGYHYLAVRLLWHVPQERFAQSYARCARAILNARAMPQMIGRSVTENGTTRFIGEKTFDL